jgi:hypothetical protein
MTDETSLREQAAANLRRRRDFPLQLIPYIGVNVVLWVIWVLTEEGFPWPLFVTVFWGIGLATQAFDIYGHRRPITRDEIDAEVRRLGGA